MCRGASKGVDTFGFSLVLRFIPCCRQWEMMALFPSSLAGAGSGFLLVMSFIFPLSKFAGWPVWFKSVLPTNAEFFKDLHIVAWIRPFVLINAF